MESNEEKAGAVAGGNDWADLQAAHEAGRHSRRTRARRLRKSPSR